MSVCATASIVLRLKSAAVRSTVWSINATGSPFDLSQSSGSPTPASSRLRTKSNAPAYIWDWLDAGKLADLGQFVLGQPLRRDRKDRAKRLPCVHELFPSIVHAHADKRDRLPACSAAEAISRRGYSGTDASHITAGS